MTELDQRTVPVFFLPDSTGISAEIMSNALLIQFPDVRFDRTLIPFTNSAEEAREVVEQLDEAMDGPVVPLVFTTAADDVVRQELIKTRAPGAQARPGGRAVAADRGTPTLQDAQGSRERGRTCWGRAGPSTSASGRAPHGC